MIEIHTKVVPLPKDGSPAVLLQLPHGYVILRPEDARVVAQELTLRSEEAEEEAQ